MNQWQLVEELREPVDGFSQPVEEVFDQWHPVEEFAQPVEEFCQPVEDFCNQWQPVEEFAQPIEEFFIFVSVCVCVFFIYCSKHLLTFSFLFSFFMLPFTPKTKFKTISSSL